MVFDPTRKSNPTPVARHFATTEPIAERFVLPPQPTWNYSLPMTRLSFGVLTPKEDRSIRNLYDLITRGQLTSRFIFPDTSFITTRIQEQFWELGNQRTIAFSEMTVAELSGWLRNPIHNSYLHTWLPRALEECRTSGLKHGPLRLANVLGTVFNRLHPLHVGILSKADMLLYGYDYYVNLLSVRKRVGIRVANELRTELGRDPTDLDVRKRLNRDYHARVVPIAFKGWKDQGKRNYMADEELVVSAVITAIMTGDATMILTWDTDIFEQFTKLVEVVSADYICYRFGLVRYVNPDGVPMRTLPTDAASTTDDGFLGAAVDTIVVSDHDADGLPPYQYTPVHCFCVLVGNNCDDPKISIAGYCLEREMDNLLLTEGETNGKNTSHFPGKNIRSGTMIRDGKIGILFAIGEERMVEYEGLTVSWFDLQRALKGDPPLVRKVWVG
jgi:hypothetical protein